MVEGPAVIAVVGDDQAHRVLIQRLVDAVLLEAAEGRRWPEADQIDQARTWWPDGSEHRTIKGGTIRLFGTQAGFYNARFVREDIRQIVPNPFLLRRIGGDVAPELLPFFDVYQLFALLDAPPDAIVMVRDTDGAADLEEQARQLIPSRIDRKKFIFGLVNPEAEAWVLGIVLAPDSDRLRLAAESLNFDPTRSPEALNSSRKPPRGKPSRDAKKVLRFLLGEGDTIDSAESKPQPPEVMEALLEGLKLAALLGDQHAGSGLRGFLLRLREDLLLKVLPG